MSEDFRSALSEIGNEWKQLQAPGKGNEDDRALVVGRFRSLCEDTLSQEKCDAFEDLDLFVLEDHSNQEVFKEVTVDIVSHIGVHVCLHDCTARHCKELLGWSAQNCSPREVLTAFGMAWTKLSNTTEGRIKLLPYIQEALLRLQTKRDRFLDSWIPSIMNLLNQAASDDSSQQICMIFKEIEQFVTPLVQHMSNKDSHLSPTLQLPRRSL